MIRMKIDDLINWFEINACDDGDHKYKIIPIDKFTELIGRLTQQYSIENDKTSCAAPNYEALYNELLEKEEALANERVIQLKLARCQGAVAMAELIYGREIHI